MFIRGKRKYWKAFAYILLVSAIAVFFSKNDQTLVKIRSKVVLTKRRDAFRQNYRQTTVNDVKPETVQVRLLNLTKIQTTVTKKTLYYKATRRNATILEGSQGELTLSDKRIDDYFSDKSYAKPEIQPEVRHIAFLKVHKAASSTMQNMFFRFGRKRNLTFVFTKHPNYFSKSTVSHFPLVPPKSSRRYDILCNHGVFNYSTYSSFLPNDTVYIGIVRDPLSVFISAVNFYSQQSQKLDYLAKIQGHKLQKLIHRPEVYDRNFFSYTKNVMSRDFGFPETFNGSVIFETLKELDKIFTLVLIVEHFEESLVLMRRYLNWKIQDILFLPNNVYIQRIQSTPPHAHLQQFQRNFEPLQQGRAIPWYDKRTAGTMRGHSREKPVSVSELSPMDIRQFKIRNKLDYYVYSFFSKKFWKQFKGASADIEKEVTYFKQVLEKLKLFCNDTGTDGERRPLTIQKSEWNEEFTITAEDCVVMRMNELKFIKILRRNQGSDLREIKNGRFPIRSGRISLEELRKRNKLQLRRNQRPIKVDLVR